MNSPIAKPFLKWAGGKTQLLDEIVERMPKVDIKCYIEPFVGSGAVALHLAQKVETLEKIYINDRNPELILVWNVIKYFVEDLIESLNELKVNYDNEETRGEEYKKIRTLFNEGITTLDTAVRFDDFSLNKEEVKDFCITRASQFIFLNKTCFNGLYRVNKKGQFNVPKGDYKNPKILDEANLRTVNNLLNREKPEFNILPPSDYSITLDMLEKLKNDGYIENEVFVYFDPPYLPISASSSFTSYSKYDFSEKDQIKLAEFFKSLASKKIHVTLSNSDPTNVDEENVFFDELFKDYTVKVDEKGIKRVERVHATRNINSKGSGRGKVKEILVTSNPKKE